MFCAILIEYIESVIRVFLLIYFWWTLLCSCWCMRDLLYKCCCVWVSSVICQYILHTMFVSRRALNCSELILSSWASSHRAVSSSSSPSMDSRQNTHLDLECLLLLDAWITQKDCSAFGGLDYCHDPAICRPIGSRENGVKKFREQGAWVQKE